MVYYSFIDIERKDYKHRKGEKGEKVLGGLSSLSTFSVQQRFSDLELKFPIIKIK